MVYLDNNSSIQYPEYFAKDKREVSLKGNAFFEISGNPQQPFIIDAGQVLVEVIGTSFEVKNTENTPFELAVLEGQVKVSLKGSNQVKYVSKDEIISLSSSGLEVTSFNNNNRFDKYLNQVFFKDVPLKDIINSINSRSEEIKLAIDPSLANNRLTVSFFNESPESIAELICFSLNLSYTKKENTLLISQP
jgi:ferric-dicitrate binding protein FerR (iron transport regulator)